jgi:6-phosphofructo-2-kinase
LDCQPEVLLHFDKGKSYICKKLAKYLSWCGFNVRIFNVGNRRRREDPGLNGNATGHDSKFFDASNTEASTLRERLVIIRINLGCRNIE